jgi:hypothetical protein
MNRRIPWWAIIISVLLATDLVWRCAELKWYGPTLAIVKRFQFREIDNPGEGKCMGIWEHGKLVYTETDFDRDGTIDAVELYWQGRPVCHLETKDGTNESGRVLEYWDGDGRKTVALLDYEGQGNFHLRSTYPQGKQRTEVWFDRAWQPMEVRDHRKGVILNNQWFPIQYSNTAWNVVK